MHSQSHRYKAMVLHAHLHIATSSLALHSGCLVLDLVLAGRFFIIGRRDKSHKEYTHGDMHNLKVQSPETCPTTFFNKNGLFARRGLVLGTSRRDRFRTLESPMAVAFFLEDTDLHNKTCLLRKFLSLNNI